MAYLGNKPVNNFVSFAKQDITGNGGTSYSLDYPVTGANDIELYINNVRQEPTEAYSCSGSTLTLTGSVSASDDVYVIFRGRALQTAQHPADSALEASSGIFSGNLKTEKHLSAGATLEDWHPNWNAIELGEYGTNIAGFNAGGGITQINHNAYKDATTNQWLSKGSWNSRAIYIDGNSLYIQRGTSAGANQQITWENHLEIDIAGRVKMPRQPSFEVSIPQTWTATSTSTYAVTQWGKTHHNVGNHFDLSNGRFTAPVDGVYQFHGIMMGVGVNGPHLAFGINGSSNGGGGTYTNNEMWVHSGANDTTLIQVYHIIELSAGDYVRLYTYSYNSVSNAPRSYFGGHLLG